MTAAAYNIIIGQPTSLSKHHILGIPGVYLSTLSPQERLNHSSDALDDSGVAAYKHDIIRLRIIGYQFDEEQYKRVTTQQISLRPTQVLFHSQHIIAVQQSFSQTFSLTFWLFLRLNNSMLI